MERPSTQSGAGENELRAAAAAPSGSVLPINTSGLLSQPQAAEPEVPTISEPLLRLPFDCYGRYAFTREVASYLWPQEQPRLRVLDVGGHSSSLKHFLPEHEVILTDIQPPPDFTHVEAIKFLHDGYLLSVGQNLPFAPRTFDLVTAHDTLEHVPAESRAAFVQELLRVSRGFVVLNGPIFDPRVVSAEEQLYDFFTRVLSWNHPYLSEHIDLGLPRAQMIEAVLEEDGARFVRVPNGKLAWWLATMAVKYYIGAFPNSSRAQEALDRAYNAVIAPRDFGGLCYRQGYVISKDGQDAARLRRVEEALVGPHAAGAELPSPARGLPVAEELISALADHASSTLGWHEETAKFLEGARHDLRVAIQQQDNLRAEKDAVLAENQALREEPNRLRRELQVRQGELEGIRLSAGYRLLERYRRIIRWLFPAGSWRSLPYQSAMSLVRFVTAPRQGHYSLSRWQRVLRLARRSVEIIRREGWRSFLRKLKRRLTGKTYGSQPLQPEMVEEIRPLTFPSLDEPLVSIVIPVFNKSLYTFNCLLSVLRNSDGPPFEVIVVDDGSSDNTQRMLAQIENIRVETNAENLGFVKTCNNGARVARGKYLVFLNNDTQVERGWLSALVDVVERDQSAGLVGAKLLFPTGKLQEAGGIVWRDASAWNYGRSDDPEKPEYNYVREVDYCSAACVLVRRDLFEQIGGFDLRYAPAYYEDTDLAFAVRKMGYKVVYQPKAVVNHFEGATAGTDTSTGVKRYQEVNMHKFRDKWRDVLDSQHLPNGQAVILVRDRRKAARAVVIDHFVPSFDRDAGSLRMYQILKILTELGLVVTFVPDNMARSEPYTQTLQQMGIEVLYGPKDVSAHLRDLGPHLQLCIVSRPDVAAMYVPMVRKCAPNAALIYDTVDLHFLREERRAEVERSESARKSAQRYRQLELALANSYDATIVVTEAERRLLLDLSPGLNVHVVPTIHEIHVSTTPLSQRRGMLFVGSFLHPPNVDAAVYLVTSILPLIRREIEDVTLYLVGADPPPEVRALASERVIVTGWVGDLSTYLETARIFVAPLRYGAGLKGKISQSMSYGLPVVTTTVGVEGMDIEDGREALVADDPQEFAAKVIGAYRDDELWGQLAEHAVRFAEANYSTEVVRAKLMEVLRLHSVDIPGGEGLPINSSSLARV